MVPLPPSPVPPPRRRRIQSIGDRPTRSRQLSPRSMFANKRSAFSAPPSPPAGIIPSSDSFPDFNIHSPPHSMSSAAPSNDASPPHTPQPPPPPLPSVTPVHKHSRSSPIRMTRAMLESLELSRGPLLTANGTFDSAGYLTPVESRLKNARSPQGNVLDGATPSQDIDRTPHHPLTLPQALFDIENSRDRPPLQKRATAPVLPSSRSQTPNFSLSSSNHPVQKRTTVPVISSRAQTPTFPSSSTLQVQKPAEVVYAEVGPPTKTQQTSPEMEPFGRSLAAINKHRNCKEFASSPNLRVVVSPPAVSATARSKTKSLSRSHGGSTLDLMPMDGSPTRRQLQNRFTFSGHSYDDSDEVRDDTLKNLVVVCRLLWRLLFVCLLAVHVALFSIS